jgi:hypothetical protein
MAKSLTNFDVTINAQKAPRLQGSTYFPFCGNLIDVVTLNVIKDFTRLDGTCKTLVLKTDGRYNGFADDGTNSDTR